MRCQEGVVVGTSYQGSPQHRAHTATVLHQAQSAVQSGTQQSLFPANYCYQQTVTADPLVRQHASSGSASTVNTRLCVSVCLWTPGFVCLFVRVHAGSRRPLMACWWPLTWPHVAWTCLACRCVCDGATAIAFADARFQQHAHALFAAHTPSISVPGLCPLSTAS